jgi:hypothetical protein
MKEERMLKKVAFLFCLFFLPVVAAMADVPLSAAAVIATNGYEKYKTGTKGVDATGYEYVYLAGVADCKANTVVAIDHDGTSTVAAVILDETEGAKGRSLAVAQSAAIANLYGWFMVKGLATVACKVSDAADAEQSCTTTPGCLDDAGTTPIHGLHALTTSTDMMTIKAYIVYPHTGN